MVCKEKRTARHERGDYLFFVRNDVFCGQLHYTEAKKNQTNDTKTRENSLFFL